MSLKNWWEEKKEERRLYKETLKAEKVKVKEERRKARLEDIKLKAVEKARRPRRSFKLPSFSKAKGGKKKSGGLGRALESLDITGGKGGGFDLDLGVGLVFGSTKRKGKKRKQDDFGGFL